MSSRRRGRSALIQRSDFKLEVHHSLDPKEALLRCAVAKPLARPGVEFLGDAITVALGDFCLASSLRQGRRRSSPLKFSLLPRSHEW